MATRVIEEPDTEVIHEHSGGSGAGLAIGLIVLLVVVLLVIFYGLPYIRSFGGATVNVPKSVNVNVNTSK